ncbi:hypothetical protein [Burkholderia ubonensis]|uniref:hypothetical protein n=1 Tax=Burkholderia ubonensis TaxID=101571 RepID=UPI0012FBD907|nr:hypothetical protein [Burkholderia ubonensis]
MIRSGVPHRERIRYATHSEFFTGSTQIGRHDLPHPIFSKHPMESIPSKTAIQDQSRFPAIASRMQLEGKAPTRKALPDKATSLRKGEQSPSAERRLIAKLRSIAARAELIKPKGLSNRKERNRCPG